MDTPSQPLEKLKHYCAYQDRCHTEVEKKLRQLGLWGNDADEVIATLITEDYLNEERYARSFARGKFRMKQWGRKKILYALKANHISPYCLRKALEEIDLQEYQEVLKKLAEKKYQSLKKDQYLRRKHKTFQYLLSRGYEAELIRETLNEIINEK